MALVTMKELLERAKSNYRGIGAFSVGNMEMVKGAIQASRRTGHSDHLADCRSKIETLPACTYGTNDGTGCKRGESRRGSASGSWTYHGDSRESTGTWIYLRHVRQLYISI